MFDAATINAASSVFGKALAPPTAAGPTISGAGDQGSPFHADGWTVATGNARATGGMAPAGAAADAFGLPGWVLPLAAALIAFAVIRRVA